MFLIILNAFFCLAFAAFAYVNLNDIDAWLWVTIYLVASVCCGLAAFGKYYPTVYLVAIAFYPFAGVAYFSFAVGLAPIAYSMPPRICFR